MHTSPTCISFALRRKGKVEETGSTTAHRLQGTAQLDNSQLLFFLFSVVW